MKQARPAHAKRKAPKAVKGARALVASMRAADAAKRAAGYVPGFSITVPCEMGERVRAFTRDCAMASGQRVGYRLAVGLLVEAGLEALGGDMRKAAKGMMR